MKKMFKRLILLILGNFLGILVASLILKDFHITGLGIFVSVLIFTLVQLILAPIIAKITNKFAPSLESLIALITTFASLILTSIFTEGLRVDGVITWLTASMLIWLLAILLGIVLPKLLFSEKNESNS